MELFNPSEKFGTIPRSMHTLFQLSILSARRSRRSSTAATPPHHAHDGVLPAHKATPGSAAAGAAVRARARVGRTVWDPVAAVDGTVNGCCPALNHASPSSCRTMVTTMFANTSADGGGDVPATDAFTSTLDLEFLQE